MCFYQYYPFVLTQIIWFTALFPYFVMSVLLVRAVTLPGASIGLWKVHILKSSVTKNNQIYKIIRINMKIQSFETFYFSTLHQIGVNLRIRRHGLIQLRKYFLLIRLELEHFPHWDHTTNFIIIALGRLL